MQTKSHVVEEKTSNMTLPAFEMIDILAVVLLVLISGLLMTDRIVPDFVVQLLILITGVKVHTQNQIIKLKNTEL